MVSRERRRLAGIAVLYVIGFALLSVRLVWLQLVHARAFRELGAKQHRLAIPLEPLRGTIYDRHLRPLALSLNLASVYANPRQIKDKPKTARAVSRALDLQEPSVLRRLARDKGFVWIARQLDPQQVDSLKRRLPEGVFVMTEPRRFYPHRTLACHLIGFTGLDHHGLEGMELAFDHALSGIPGWRFTHRDAKQRPIASMEYRYLPPLDGHHVVLTIDQTIQYITERALDRMLAKYRANGAMAIVMDPWTGEILAMASRPAYDLNRFKEALSDTRRNRAIVDPFEPGSVFKIVPASALLEERAVSLRETFYCENGAFPIRGHVLHDHRPHGTLTFQQVIERSSNIGTVKASLKLGEERLRRYMKQFGFGAATGLPLHGEAPGWVKPTHQWSKVSMTAMPIGQEVTVTALQLAAAIAVIANGGELVKPILVKEIQDLHGATIKTFHPTTVRRVISPETASAMQGVLQGAVERGTGVMAKLKGYTAAGKTGTAQKVDPSGIYSHSKFIASFIGFAPAESPKLVVAVVFDEPRPVYYGGVVAAPVFKEICEETLRYLRVPTTTVVAQKQP